jgi:hypothetical protein
MPRHYALVSIHYTSYGNTLNLPDMPSIAQEEEANLYQPNPRGHRPVACGAGSGRTKGQEVEGKQGSIGRGIRT